MPASLTDQSDSFSYQLGAGGHRGTPAIKRLVEYAPASGGLALWMQHRDVQQIPSTIVFANADNRRNKRPWIIGNDGKTIFYGPEFTQRSLAEQTGLIAHQVLHVALRHVDREQQLRRRIGQIDAELYAVCADAIVNASLSHLTWLELPKGSVFLDTLLYNVLGIDEPLDVSLHQWDTESLYRAIDDRQSSSGGGQRSQATMGKDDQYTQDSKANTSANSKAGGKQSDNAQNNSTPNNKGDSGTATQRNSAQSESFTDGPKATIARQLAQTIIRDLVPASEESPETETSQALQWKERLVRAHATDGEQSFMRQLLADNTALKTPWEQVLRTRVQRAISLQADLNWSRPTRSWLANRGRTASGHRMPWQPGTSYSRDCPRLCIMVDVSGSVSDKLMQRFASEIDRIIRTFKTEALLIVGDDKVREQKPLKSGVSALRSIQFNGGGGTDFAPLILAANAFNPDIGLFLTDLEGPAGDSPLWPIIWAVPADANIQPVPYGQRIILD